MVGCPRLAALDLRAKDTAASLVNRLSRGGPLFLGPIVALPSHYEAEAYQADTYLGQGGSFAHETQPRSLTQSCPANSYLSRLWLKVVLPAWPPSPG